jgi:hypothetical protein
MVIVIDSIEMISPGVLILCCHATRKSFSYTGAGGTATTAGSDDELPNQNSDIGSLNSVQIKRGISETYGDYEVRDGRY